jgi:DNA-binding GntR family transcriptional regulator
MTQSSSQRAITQLRQLIFSGALPAGSDHLESELAERLNMSRTPVREAALMLESQGLLEMRPRKGVRILPVSAGDMREIYEVLTELECLSAERAARHSVKESDLAALARSIEDMDVALRAGDLEQWAQADEGFHSELVRLGGNSRAINIAGMMQDQVRRARLVTLHMRPVPSQSNQDHRGVLEAIRRGDAEAARSIHKNHRDVAQKLILALLEKHRLHLL